MTLNEPYVSAVKGYGLGSFAPGIGGIGTSTYVAAHNQIIAHARAYRLYHNEFAVQQQGTVKITENVPMYFETFTPQVRLALCLTFTGASR